MDDLRMLRILLRFVETAPPRDIQVIRPLTTPTVVYSDASYDGQTLRLGWVIFKPSAVPLGGSTVVPETVLSSWIPRIQQIYPGETLAVLVASVLCPDHLAHSDLLWFVDNESAVSALIRSSTSQEDVHLISQATHVQLHSLGCRLWVEWVDSESNVSDGLSRKGTLDPWTRERNWQLRDFPFPQGLDRESLLRLFLRLKTLLDSGCTMGVG